MRLQVPDILLTPITDEATLETVLAHSFQKPIVLFKHSRRCGISYQAREEVLQLAAARSVPVYEVVVQTARSVSDAITRRLGIRHETPQAFVIYRGQVVFHASHYAITTHALAQTLDRLVTFNRTDQ